MGEGTGREGATKQPGETNSYAGRATGGGFCSRRGRGRGIGKKCGRSFLSKEGEEVDGKEVSTDLSEISRRSKKGGTWKKETSHEEGSKKTSSIREKTGAQEVKIYK